MAITDPLVLPPDVRLVAVAELPEAVRRQLAGEPGDWALTRPGLRTASRIVDASAAALLAELRSPTTLVEAVLRYSRGRGLDPEATLTDAYPLLAQLFAAGFLVPEGEGAILPTLAPGDAVAGFSVLACVRSLADSEVYQVRREGVTAALKIERRPAAAEAPDLPPGGPLAREAAILQHCAGLAPRCLAQGDLAGRSFLAVEWFPGVAATVAASEAGEDRPALLALGRSLLAAYAGLHARGVLHGDVHPGNALVAAGGQVRLVDFGQASWAGVPPCPGRAGVGFFYEPEQAAALRAGAPCPPVSPEGEQHAVAALLYRLLTGAHYRDFSLEKAEMLRQIAAEPPLPFAARGVAPWPAVEALLARALAKRPEERFPSLADLASAWDRLSVPAAPGDPSRAAPHRRAEPGAAERLLARVLARVTPAGMQLASGLPEPPCASLNGGTAGIAYALYRIALAREDAALLCAADLWNARARQAGEDGFYTAELTPERVGRVSPYHTASGPPAVQALLAHAAGEPVSQAKAIADFLAAVRAPEPRLDLTLGRAGVLLALALLLDTLPAGEPGAALRELGDTRLAELWRELAALPAIPDGEPRPNLGMAHGWAGSLYASLRWCRAVGRPWPAGLSARLAELAGCAELWGRGLRWRWYGEGRWQEAGTMPGWCNGSAGFVHLFTLAHEAFGEPLYRRLAEGAAWNAWEVPEANGSLCCGLAGRAYALLHLHRHGGGREWLGRARQLAERAASDLSWAAESPDSLYRGEVGLAVLAADLARPEDAAMPFFEDEGWGRHRA